MYMEPTPQIFKSLDLVNITGCLHQWTAKQSPLRIKEYFLPSGKNYAAGLKKNHHMMSMNSLQRDSILFRLSSVGYFQRTRRLILGKIMFCVKMKLIPNTSCLLFLSPNLMKLTKEN